MELFFKEKMSLKGKTEITDAEGKAVYTSKDGGFFIAKTYLMDAEKNKLATIETRGGRFNMHYDIKVGKERIARIKKKLSIGSQKLSIKELGWDIKGNFTAKEYTITKGEETVATIKRAKLISLLEGYSIDIPNEENAEKVVCIALVLNNILKSKKGKLLSKL